jgi:hypothetical protein
MSSLCGICQTIPFQSLQENPDQNIRHIGLGTYDELKQRKTCKFCWLILEAIDLTSFTLGGQDAWGNVADLRLDWFETQSCFQVDKCLFFFRYTSGTSNTLGRVVEPVPINTDTLLSLLTDCDAHHQCLLPMSANSAQKIPRLRAINVREMCITSIAPSERYAALSYVWGSTSIPFLLRANREELMRPGALERLCAKIPLTIKDAMELVRKMGLEYLWVDALCLVQDDPDDMATGIDAMGLIFEHAYFAIVAAQGYDADAGLAGVGPRKINQIKAEILPGITLVGNAVEDEYIDFATYYGKRAWTSVSHPSPGDKHLLKPSLASKNTSCRNANSYLLTIWSLINARQVHGPKVSRIERGKAL